MKYFILVFSFVCISCSPSLPTMEDYYGVYLNSDSTKNEKLILYFDRIYPSTKYSWLKYLHIVRDSEVSTGEWRFDGGSRIESFKANVRGIILNRWKELNGDTLTWIYGVVHFGKENKYAIVLDSFRTYAPVHPMMFVKQLYK